MPRVALPAAVLLILIGGAAWWLMSSDGMTPEASPQLGVAERHARPERGNLDSLPTGEGGDLAAGSGEAPKREEIEPSTEPEAVAPNAWFRGNLRVVRGTLTTPPQLGARITPAPGAPLEQRSIGLDRATLEFEVAVAGRAPDCFLVFPDFLRPVAVNGVETRDQQAVTIAPPGERTVIDVEVRPHLAVLCLHDPSGRPLANGSINTALQHEGSSVSWGERLDAAGMHFFDLERRHDMGNASELQFTVSWPPEIGSSTAPPIPVSDLELLPQPIILRFASTPTLHFKIVSADHQPIEGATVRLGNVHSTDEKSDAEGRVAALQSSPPSPTVMVQADGFLTVNEPLTAASQVEQEVMLWPGSWILLIGTEQPEEGWGQLDVEIRFDGNADGSLLTAERFTTGSFTESSGGTGTTSNRRERRFKHNTSLSSEGRAKLDGIHVDVPATVVVTYRGIVLLETRVPIRPGDGEHLVDVPALPELVPLHGRVVDLAGRGLDGVEVRARFSERDSVTVASAQDGRFELGGVPEGALVTLSFVKPGFGRRALDQLAEQRDEDSVGSVTLAPGRSMIVQVLDPEGRPFAPMAGTRSAAFQPHANFHGGRIDPTSTPGLAPGEWSFVDLPEGELVFILPNRHKWDEIEHPRDTSQPHVTLTLTAEAMKWLAEEEQ